MPQPARLRHYHQTGLYSRAEPLPEVQQAMAELRAALVADLGGDPSTAQSLIIDMVANQALKLRRVDEYIATLPRLVDRKYRRVLRIVEDSSRLASHLAGLLDKLGLERRAKRLDIAATFAAMREQGADGDENAAVSRQDARRAPQAPK